MSGCLLGAGDTKDKIKYLPHGVQALEGQDRQQIYRQNVRKGKKEVSGRERKGG